MGSVLAAHPVPVSFPQSAVSKIEKPDKAGRRRAITIDEALAISRVLDVPLLALLNPHDADVNLRRLMQRLVAAREAVVEASSTELQIMEELRLVSERDPEIMYKLAALARHTTDRTLVETFLTGLGFGVEWGEDEEAETITVTLPPRDDDGA